MRIQDMGTFATRGLFRVPESLKGKSAPLRLQAARYVAELSSQGEAVSQPLMCSHPSWRTASKPTRHWWQPEFPWRTRVR
jgi:hypothetical protein